MTVFDIAVGTLMSPFVTTRYVAPLSLVHEVDTSDAKSFKTSISDKAMLLPGMGVTHPDATGM